MIGENGIKDLHPKCLFERRGDGRNRGSAREAVLGFHSRFLGANAVLPDQEIAG